MSRPQLYLLDTNTCIHIMNAEPAQVRANMLAATQAGDVLGISTVVQHELWFGIWRSVRQATNAARLSRFMADMDVFPFDSAAAEKASEIRAALVSVGTPIGPYDTLIAGHALSLSAVLVTNNLAEFTRVPGLACEDWTQAKK